MNKKTLSVAILSGKGGVGKSNIALNLAYTLQSSGDKVLLMDCDLGLANLDVLLGLTPEGSIEQLFHSDVPVDSVVIPLVEDRLYILPASSGMHSPADYASTMRSLLLNRLNPYAANFDYVILDIGAGISVPVQTFAALSAMRVVIVTPEPTSVTDSYALMKVMSTGQQVSKFFILVNQALSEEEARLTYDRLNSACSHFLGFSPEYLGFIRSSVQVEEAVLRQQPFVLRDPKSDPSRDLMAVAARLHQVGIAMQDELVAGKPMRPVGE